MKWKLKYPIITFLSLVLSLVFILGFVHPKAFAQACDPPCPPDQFGPNFCCGSGNQLCNFVTHWQCRSGSCFPFEYPTAQGHSSCPCGCSGGSCLSCYSYQYQYQYQYQGQPYPYQYEGEPYPYQYQGQPYPYQYQGQPYGTELLPYNYEYQYQYQSQPYPYQYQGQPYPYQYQGQYGSQYSGQYSYQTEPCPGGTCLGNGAGGCSSLPGCSCCSGTTCRNDVCRGSRPPPPRCDPLGPFSGSPTNGTTGLPSDVTLTWGTNDDPVRGACSGSGRQFTVTWGNCPTSSFGSGCSPAIGSFSGTSSGGSFYCFGRPSPDAGNQPWSTIAAGLPGGWHWWRAFIECNCRNCEGGSPPADSGFLTFQTGPGRPGTPTLACQTITSGDTYPDICDVSQGSPTGYGSVNRYNLSAVDGGPTTARQPSFSHRYSVTDVTNPLAPISLPLIIGPNNGPNALFSVDMRAYLIDGHRYSWSVTTWDNALPLNPTPNSFPSATWTFLYDLTIPRVGISDPNGCFDLTTPGLALPTSIPFSVVDPIPPPGAPNQASNIRNVVVTVQNQTNRTTPVDNQEIWPAASIYGSCSWPSNPGVGNGTCNLNTAPWALTAPGGNVYLITATATDNAGNVGSNSERFMYRTTCIGPWLQTTQGDVHSNTNVHTPGGPD